MDQKIRLIAGTFILLSQSSVTRWCLMEDILRATGIHRDEAATQ